MKIKNKTLIYIIIGIIFVVLVLAFFFYQTLKPKSPSTSSTGQSVKPTTNETIIAQLALNEKIFYPTLSADGKSLIYLGDKGIIFYKYDLASGQKNKLINQEVLGTMATAYSPDTKKVIVFSNYPEINVNFYNLDNQQISNLNSNIIEATWLNNDKIVYAFFDNDSKKYQISTSSSDGSGWQKLLDLGYSDAGYELLKKDDKSIYYYFLTSSPRATQIYSLDLNSKQTSKVMNDQVFDPIFAPNMNEVVYTKAINNTEPGKSVLQFVDKGIQKELTYQIDSTRSVWTKDSKKFISIINQDNNIYLYSLDTTSNQESVTVLQVPNTEIGNFKNLLISGDNKTLYFTINNVLYKIDLK